MSGINFDINTCDFDRTEVDPAVDPPSVAADRAKRDAVIGRLKARRIGNPTREEFNDLLDILGL